MVSDIKYGRKRSGIKKALRKKLDDWLSTITDEAVRKAAEKDSIVTGGAIASMLLGEKVNDFDVYFRSMETAKLVAQYYVDLLSANNGSYSGAQVKLEEVANIKGLLEERVIIFIESSGVVEADKPKTKNKLKYQPSFMSENAITLTNKIQLITRFYGEPDAIHDNYDFVHAKCYWDNGSQKLVLPAEALECLMSRTLRYAGSLYPIASIFRTKKFLERGWRISAGQQLKIMWQISEINLRDPVVMREQLTGVDYAYLQCLIEALDGVDPEKLVSTYVCEVIDRIFDEQ